MAQIIVDEHEEGSDPKMSGEELAVRVFTVSMVGVVAVILLMIILGQ